MGAVKLIKILDRVSSFTRIEFGIEDIVRSKTVKEHIVAKMDIEDLESSDSNNNTDLENNKLPKFISG